MDRVVYTLQVLQLLFDPFLSSALIPRPCVSEHGFLSPIASADALFILDAHPPRIEVQGPFPRQAF